MIYEDPLFDAWWLDEPTEPAKPKARRWSTPPEGVRRSAPVQPVTSPEPAVTLASLVGAMADASEVGTTDVRTAAADLPAAESESIETYDLDEPLREALWPSVELTCKRLRVAGHRCEVEDGSSAAREVVTVRIAPRRAPFDVEPSDTEAVLELGIDDSESGQAVARSWVGAGDERQELESSIPVAEMDETWVEDRLLDFVERVLCMR